MRQSQGKPLLLRSSIVGALVLAVVVGCAGGQGKGAGQAEPQDPPEEETLEPWGAWPLTGVVVPGEDEDGHEVPEPAFDQPALSVKIENSPGSRPQDGLEHADVVWEQLVEGGMTRFVAMYHSDVPQTLGPIRSVRPMDAAIAGPVGGVLAFSGGMAEYQHKVRDAGLVMAQDDAGSAGFYRDPNRSGDHRLFGHPEEFLALASEQDGPGDLFDFAAEDDDPSAVRDGDRAEGVQVTFPASRPSWEWDGELWQRSESGSPAMAESGERLTATNVVVVFVDIRDTGHRDGAGSMVPETILTGEGESAVFTGGHVLEGTWSKGQATDRLELHDSDGEPVLLDPGNTWVELVPRSGGGINIL